MKATKRDWERASFQHLDAEMAAFLLAVPSNQPAYNSLPGGPNPSPSPSCLFATKLVFQIVCKVQNGTQEVRSAGAQQGMRE